MEGVSDDESHYTVWTVWISVGVRVRAGLYIAEFSAPWHPLICTQSQNDWAKKRPTGFYALFSVYMLVVKKCPVNNADRQ